MSQAGPGLERITGTLGQFLYTKGLQRGDKDKYELNRASARDKVPREFKGSTQNGLLGRTGMGARIFH